MYNLFMSAPITNNGYYDIPIDNQYSNTDYARNNASYTRNVNKDLQNKINNNRENYIMLNQKTIPDRTLFYEDNKKKNEDTEYFSNNSNTNYSNTNYSYIDNDQKLLSNGMRDYGIVNYHTINNEYSQKSYSDINNNMNNDINNDINKKLNNNLLINKLNMNKKINKLEKPYKKELIVNNIENKKVIKKVSKKKKKESDNDFFNKKTLWNIIYAMFIIILLLLIKIFYDNKIITIK